MEKFKDFILNEKILSIGLNSEHEKHREELRPQIHDMIRNSYVKIGGYGGHASGSSEESSAIHSDISNSLIKAIKRGNNVTAVNMYKPQFGRKSIAAATDGTHQGKQDFKLIKREDKGMQRSWGEVSGAVERHAAEIGMPTIPTSLASKLLPGKSITPVGDTGHYERTIGGKKHTKIMVGYPKL